MLDRVGRGSKVPPDPKSTPDPKSARYQKKKKNLRPEK